VRSTLAKLLPGLPPLFLTSASHKAILHFKWRALSPVFGVPAASRQTADKMNAFSSAVREEEESFQFKGTSNFGSAHAEREVAFLAVPKGNKERDESLAL
jgi:hypothetical protein